MNKEAFGMLGILNRAKVVAYGPALENSLRKGHLLLLAKDASPRTLKTLENKATTQHLSIAYIDSKEELGAPLGKDELSAVLITNAKAAQSLLSKLQKGESNEEK